MLVSGGKILALSKVEKDETLAGLGTPDSPLGIKNPKQYAQKDWVEDTFVSADYLKENYWTSAATSAAVEARIRQIPGATEYSAGKGIKVEDYIISMQDSAFDPYAKKQWVQDNFLSGVPEGYATEQWVEGQKYLQEEDLEPYATKEFVTSADGIIKTWIENNYWTSSATSAEIARQLADFGGFEPVDELPETGDPKKIYLIHSSDVGDDQYKEWIWNNNTWLCIGDTSMDLTPYAKTEDVNQQFADTSAWALATFHQPSGNYVTSAEFDDYKTEVQTEFENTSAWAKGTFASASDLAELAEDVLELERNVADEFENTSAWANETFQPKGEYVTDEEFETYQTEVAEEFTNTSAWAKDTFVSANEFDEYKTQVREALEGKLDKSEFDTYSAGIDEDLGNISASLDDKLNRAETTEWDVTPYVGKDGIKVDEETHEISVSAQYVTPEALQTELEGYYTKDQTSGAEALAEEFAKYQLSGDYITSADADERYLPKDWSADKDVQPYEGDGEYIKVEDHKIILDKVPQVVSVSSTDNSVDVSEVPTPEGIMYDLSVKPVDETVISGENGVSAKYDEVEKAWLVGLSENSSYDYAEAKQSSGQALYAERTVLANFSSTSIVGDGIAVVPATGVITLKRGLYHIDMQVDVTVAGNPLPEYNSISLELANYAGGAAGSTIKSVVHELDVSYAHTETISVSFDFQVNNNQSNVVIALDQFGAGVSTARVRNFNVHEVVTIDGILNGDIEIYNAGPGISIEDDVQGKMILVNAGPGLSADPITNKLCVACGSGLKIDEQGGVMAVTLDEMTEQVVETVQQMEKDMESKITTNFPQAGITITNSYVPAGSNSQYHSNKGYVYGNLFNIAMNHKIEIGKTHLGVYCKQNDNQNKYILGIYEYQPDYERKNAQGDITGYGRTVAKCDTGFVEILPGFHEYPVIHLNNTIGTTSAETDDTMNTKNFYYAAIFFPKNRVGEQGLWLGSAPGYNTQLNECKPQLMCAYNDIPAETGKTYSDDLSFNDFGFTWAYTNYDDPTATQGTSAPMECYDSMRFFMQIRNHQ